MAGRSVATDCNNLLVVSAGRVDLILETIESQNKFIEVIRAIKTAGNHAIDLTSQILADKNAVSEFETSSFLVMCDDSQLPG